MKKVFLLVGCFVLLAIVYQNAYAQQKYRWEKQQKQYRRIVADKDLTGHYLTLGSSLLSSGYYGGLAGIGYEYRFHILGVNFSVGGGKNILSERFDHPPPYYLSANVGVKLYLANEIRFLKNLYFNFLPFCYFGQYRNHTSDIIVKGNSIVLVDEYQYPHLFGIGLFLGYSPVWHINKIVSFGINVDVGIKTTYQFKMNPNWFPFNWDLGMVLKFDYYKRPNHFKNLLKKYVIKRRR